MKIPRRDFIALVGTTAVAWPLTASAQQPAMPVVGFLSAASPGPYAPFITAFRQGLAEFGYVEGQNVAIEYHWALGQYDRLPELAAELVRRRVAVIAALGTNAARAAKAATATIPIVFSVAGDAVTLGLVASLSRPGGNTTGVGYMSVELGAKRLGLLNELLPGAARFAMFINPNSPYAEPSVVAELQAGAAAIGRQIEILTASTSRDIDAAFATLVQKPVDALLVTPDSFFISRRVQFVTLAAHQRLPAIYNIRDYVEAGGLMSYGSSLTNNYLQAGIYTGRILKGEKPSDLPVTQAAKFEMVINLTTAKALGITMPPTLLALADEVIE